MRQFILGKKVAYPTQTDITKVADGAVGFYYDKDGIPTPSSTGTDLPKRFMLIAGRDKLKGGPIVIPVDKTSFSFVKGVYSPATTFTASITVPAPTVIGDYSIIAVIKGKKFNERNKYTSVIYVKDTEMTASELAEKFVKEFNANATFTGLTVTAAEGVITFTATKAGQDYELIGADYLSDIDVTYTARGTESYGNADYVKDLMDKAMADKGYEYTYRDDASMLYPNLDKSPLEAADVTDTGFTIFTLKFGETTAVNTRDDVVNQIVQVAFPTGTAAIATFETVCNAISK